MSVSFRSRVGPSPLPCLLACTAVAVSAVPWPAPCQIDIASEVSFLEMLLEKLLRFTKRRNRTFVSQAAMWVAPFTIHDEPNAQWVNIFRVFRVR